jgi:hypothetical protein
MIYTEHKLYISNMAPLPNILFLSMGVDTHACTHPPICGKGLSTSGVHYDVDMMGGYPEL